MSRRRADVPWYTEAHACVRACNDTDLEALSLEQLERTRDELKHHLGEAKEAIAGIKAQLVSSLPFDEYEPKERARRHSVQTLIRIQRALSKVNSQLKARNRQATPTPDTRPTGKVDLDRAVKLWIQLGEALGQEIVDDWGEEDEVGAALGAGDDGP